MSPLALLTASLLTAAPADGWRLPVIKEPADFTLTDQAGRPFRLGEARGKVLLVSFVFTTCSGTCPATTLRLGVLQRELRKRDLFAENKVHFLSITLDPTRDTPEVLRSYMRLHNLDSAHWTFLTGAPDVVAKVHADWGMWAHPLPSGQLDHPSRIFLLDPRGRLREIYNLDFLRIPWVAEDIEQLLREAR
jgi:protein SCO1/2